MTQDRVYWYATSNAPEGERKPGNEKAGLAKIFKGWHTPIESLIDATDESAIFRNDIYDRPGLNKWGEGRVTLLGDAAHPMTPNLGQGACQALEDAVVLARCLSGSPDTASALADYETQRIPRANWFVNQSRQVGTIGQWQHPIAVTLRNALIKLLSPRMQERQLERIVRYEL